VEHREPVHFERAPRHARRPARRAGLLVAAALLLVAPAGPATAAPAPPTPRPSATNDATGSVLEGIDVSHWQGTIDWGKVAAAGKKFAIIKATESIDFVDDHYATNHSAAKAKGIWTGAYHFARPSSTAGDAVNEADWFASHIGLGAGDLIPALDLEVSGSLSITALQSWVKSFLDRVTARTGVRPMVYTSPAFWKKYMGDTTAIADAGYKILWVAHWGVSAPTVPASNWGGRGWTFWQYSNCGSVPGISGCVDLDRYNGTDLGAVAYSTFKLTATAPSGVKQGASGTASVGIIRTNFDAGVQLDVKGLPAGSTLSFDANPVDDNGALMTVKTASDPAATSTGTYPLTITGQANGLTRTTTMNFVVLDGIAPTLTRPVTRLVTGRSIGSTVPVCVTWSRSDPSGIGGVALQRRVNGGSWTSARLSSSQATSWWTSQTSGSTLQPRVKVSDKLSNTTDWQTAPISKVSIVQQTTSAAAWSSGWHSMSSSSYSGGTAKYATARGASVTYKFTGSSIAWVAAKGPSRGSATVYLDGKAVATISLYSSTFTPRYLAFARNFGVNGTHTLKIVVAGTAGHARVDVDAFVKQALY
jgi:GH25 family lysozyme M1 (1,4-beta-N-acetylmuramidase)